MRCQRSFDDVHLQDGSDVGQGPVLCVTPSAAEAKLNHDTVAGGWRCSAAANCKTSGICKLAHLDLVSAASSPALARQARRFANIRRLAVYLAAKQG